MAADLDVQSKCHTSTAELTFLALETVQEYFTFWRSEWNWSQATVQNNPNAWWWLWYTVLSASVKCHIDVQKGLTELETSLNWSVTVWKQEKSCTPALRVYFYCPRREMCAMRFESFSRSWGRFGPELLGGKLAYHLCRCSQPSPVSDPITLLQQDGSLNFWWHQSQGPSLGLGITVLMVTGEPRFIYFNASFTMVLEMKTIMDFIIPMVNHLLNSQILSAICKYFLSQTQIPVQSRCFSLWDVLVLLRSYEWNPFLNICPCDCLVWCFKTRLNWLHEGSKVVCCSVRGR